MKPFRLVLRSLLAGGAIALISCTEGSPTAPASANVAPALERGALDDLFGSVAHLPKNLGLLSCAPVASASASKVIGPEGGVLQVGANTLTVPAGALLRDVNISGVAPSGNVNRIEFEPEGLRFHKPAKLEMGYANCDLMGNLSPKHIAYTTDELRILDLLKTVDDLRSRTLTTELKHFSDYAIAW